MILSITHQLATDPGFLLRKNPENSQSFAPSFGRAHVYYPEATNEWFYLPASEGHVHADKTYEWHMQTLAWLAGYLHVATPYRIVNLNDAPDAAVFGILALESEPVDPRL